MFDMIIFRIFPVYSPHSLVHPVYPALCAHLVTDVSSRLCLNSDCFSTLYFTSAAFALLNMGWLRSLSQVKVMPGLLQNDSRQGWQWRGWNMWANMSNFSRFYIEDFSCSTNLHFWVQHMANLCLLPSCILPCTNTVTLRERYWNPLYLLALWTAASFYDWRGFHQWNQQCNFLLRLRSSSLHALMKWI